MVVMGNPPPLVVIRGDEDLLVARAVAKVVAAAMQVDPETERREASAVEIGVGDFADLVAPSLFAEPRVVVLRNLQEATKDLAEAIAGYAADPVEGVTVVVHHSGALRNRPIMDKLVKGGAPTVECVKIKDASDRIAFVRKEITEAGGTTDPEAVATLVDAVGTDLAELASAAAQLVADTDGRIDVAAVQRYHRGRADVSGFAVADLAVAGNTGAALEALRWSLITGTAPILVADALAGGIVSLAKVAGARAGSPAQLASELGMPPWKINKLRSPARAWSARGLGAAMRVVTQLNADVKGGATDADYALERAVIAIGRASRMA